MAVGDIWDVGWGGGAKQEMGKKFLVLYFQKLQVLSCFIIPLTTYDTVHTFLDKNATFSVSFGRKVKCQQKAANCA